MKKTNGLRVPIPCIKGSCGDRLEIFQAVIQPADICSILGHDPRSKNWSSLPDNVQKIYSYLQRKTSKTRRDSLTDYIKDRILNDELTIGAFPALAIGMTAPAEFENHPSAEMGMGIIHFDISKRSYRVLLDGLGRVTAALDLLDTDDESLTEQINEKLPFMVTFYAPSEAKGELRMEELGQLFHDFNFLAEPVSKGQAVDLDQSNIYITLTNKLADVPVIKNHGGVEPRAASLGKKSTALVAKQVLLKFVKAACEGDLQIVNVMRRSPQDGKLTVNSLGELERRIVLFFDAFAEVMGKSFTERDYVHLSASGWGALGMLFHDLHFTLHLSDEELTAKSRAAGAIDWSRTNRDWIGYLGGSEDVEGGRLGKVFGGRAIERILDYARHQICIVDDLKLAGVPVRDIGHKIAVAS